MLRREMQKQIMALRAPNSCLSPHSLYTTNRFMASPTFFIATNVFSKTKLRAPRRLRAGSREDEEKDSGNGLSKEDWNYVLQIGAGSVAGAAVIKYGSVVFPEITKPNIFLALFMISTPVVVAIVLLTKQSRV